MNIKIHGDCDERFLPLREAFAANFADGLEIGASLAATWRGRLVVDLWAGFRDPARTLPWEENTIVNVTSTTKVMAVISLLMLVDRGQIALDERVACYWPEFGQGGKAEVTVRDALTHRAGVPGFEPPATAAMALDWDAITTRLAAEPHWFAGKRRLCYHTLTYGYLLGELIRRVDGRLPSQFFREEIAEKIGADFQLKLLSATDRPRIAKLGLPEDTDAEDAFMAKLLQAIDWADTSNLHRLMAENPGVNGFGNGRSIARVCAIIANGGILGGVRFLSEDMIAEAGREQAYEHCPYTGWLRIGLGLGLDSKEYPAPAPTMLHWGGYGGSWAGMDHRAGVSFGYAPNNWVVTKSDAIQWTSEDDPRLVRIFGALGEVLSQI